MKTSLASSMPQTEIGNRPLAVAQGSRIKSSHETTPLFHSMKRPPLPARLALAASAKQANQVFIAHPGNLIAAELLYLAHEAADILSGARLDEGEQVACRPDPVQFRLLLGCERAGSILTSKPPAAMAPCESSIPPRLAILHTFCLDPGPDGRWRNSTERGNDREIQ